MLEDKKIQKLADLGNQFFKYGKFLGTDEVKIAQQKLEGYLSQNSAELYYLLTGLPSLWIFTIVINVITEEIELIWLLATIPLILVILILIYIGLKKKNQELYKRLPNYISCIANSREGSLDDISKTLGYPYETVVSDIQLLINKDILDNTYINHANRKIVSPILGKYNTQQPNSLICPNCGANNEFYGKNSECEFCGSVIS